MTSTEYSADRLEPEDSRWLLSLQDTDENEEWHLFRVNLEDPDAPAVDLTPLPAGSRGFSAEPLRSRTGTVVATMNSHPASMDVLLIDVSTGEISLHHEQPSPGVDLLMAREGEPAFLARVTDEGDTEFSALDPDTGEERVLRRAEGADHPMGVEIQHASPGGTGLILGSYLDGDDLQLVRIDRWTDDVLAAVESWRLDIMSVLAPGQRSDDQTKPLTNQTFFERIYIGEEEDPDAMLAKPFGSLAPTGSSLVGVRVRQPRRKIGDLQSASQIDSDEHPVSGALRRMRDLQSAQQIDWDEHPNPELCGG